MRVVSLAGRMLARDWRSGELAVLLFALTIAVAALTGVGFLVERIAAAMALQASEVLAADLRLSSPQGMPSQYGQEAQNRNLKTARVTQVLSVVFNGETSQLSNLRAVSAAYPLRGVVRTSNEPFGVPVLAQGVPAVGEVWPDSKLLASLGATVGAELAIGARNFKVTQVLISRPDQDGSFADLAPSLLMNEQDLPATQLIQPGSRVTYHHLFSGAASQVAAFKTWLRDNKRASERIRDLAEGSPQLTAAIERAGRFLSLASLVSVLLCAIAVAMSARRYVQRHLDSVALLKTLGATRRFTFTLSLLQLLWIALLAVVLGTIIGFVAQNWLITVLRDLINPALLPAPGIKPALVGLIAATALLVGFALPPLIQLAQVPAIRILRRDVGPPTLTTLLTFGPAVAVIAVLVFQVAPDLQLSLSFIAALAVFSLALAGAAALLVNTASKLRGKVGVAWRYGIANLTRRRTDTLIQIAAFGLGFMVLLLLALVRGDLNDDWRRSLPESTPNFFFINIPPTERAAFVGFLQRNDAAMSRMLPMIRGRLTHINDRPVDGMAFAEEEGESFAMREQNLTWSDQLGEDNRIVAGQWWQPADFGKPLASLEADFQDSLGVKLGDRLTFDLAGEQRTVTVASTREVNWDSFQPNFFIMFPPQLLDELAGTYMTSANLPGNRSGMLAALARRFPSVSIFDIDNLLNQVRTVMNKAVLAVQSVFFFTLFAGLTVMLAAIQSSREERRRENAILRTLGASRGVLLAGVVAEFATLGLIAGTLAAVGASVGAYFIARYLLWTPYEFEFYTVLTSIGLSVVLVILSGWLAMRPVLRQSPALVLRG
jgi:putative ABC transport system permease protein